jgi:hypothetical protein
MAARNVGNHGARKKRLRNDPRLEIIREKAPPARPGNHFQPANFRHLRLKLMVKRRHKAHLQTEIAQSQIRWHKRRGRNNAYGTSLRLSDHLLI